MTKNWVQCSKKTLKGFVNSGNLCCLTYPLLLLPFLWRASQGGMIAIFRLLYGTRYHFLDVLARKRVGALGAAYTCPHWGFGFFGVAWGKQIIPIYASHLDKGGKEEIFAISMQERSPLIYVNFNLNFLKSVIFNV